MSTATLPAHISPTVPTTVARVQLGGAVAMQQTIEDLNTIRAFVASEMKEGLDYGIIPGTGTKPTLLLPGSQKILMYFNGYPDYEIQPLPLDGGHVEYIVKTRLLSRASHQPIGSGLGSCSTMESKYRYRKSARTCPRCGTEAVIKGREEYGGGWLCHRKAGGCGAKFRDGDRTVEGQAVGRIENPDIYDVRNTVLKMAKKRSLVDATLGLGCLTELFTQDLDEFQPPPPHEETAAGTGTEEAKKAVNETFPTKPKPKPEGKPVSRPEPTPGPKTEDWTGWITRRLADENLEFRNHQKIEGVAKEKVTDLANQWQCANFLGSLLVQAGIISEEEILDNMGKRNKARTLEVVRGYFAQYPEWTRQQVEGHLTELWARECTRKGIYNPKEREDTSAQDGVEHASQETPGGREPGEEG